MDIITTLKDLQQDLYDVKQRIRNLENATLTNSDKSPKSMAHLKNTND